MKYSHKLSDAVHVMAYISIRQDKNPSSKTIAESVNANPSLIRKLLSILTKANLLISHPGIAGRKLARPATQISLLDIYLALDGNDLLHIDDKTNPNCPVGANIQKVLDKAYRKVQSAAEKEMDDISLAQIIDDVTKEIKKGENNK